jgi:hypothetical protein
MTNLFQSIGALSRLVQIGMTSVSAKLECPLTAKLECPLLGLTQ